MITRRAVLGSSLSVAFGCGCSHAAVDDRCWLEGKEAENLIARTPRHYSFDGNDPPIIHSSGNELLDRALARALFRLSRDFDVLPGFGYYEGRGAHATSKVRLARADGTVLFGVEFLNRLLSRPDNPDACVVAVCAHEFAHIVQYKLGLAAKLRASHPTVKNLELHADFLSGWFAGLRKRNNPDYPAVVYAALARDSGSQILDDPQFHGTPAERGTAVEQGFLAGARDKLSLEQAIEAGMRHIQGGFKSAPVVPYR